MQFCEDLVDAFKTQKEDPVELLTTIGILSEQVNENCRRLEKRQFIITLLEELERNPVVVEKIGWDLCGELMTFLDPRNINVSQPLRSSPIIPHVMRCFNVVALHGNPKQVLLTACELLSNLTFEEEDKAARDAEKTKTEKDREDDAIADPNADLSEHVLEREPADFFIGIKMHILFELISTSMKRLSTLYPSKYLGVAVSAIESFITNNGSSIDDPNVLLRRVYNICRSYEPPELPEDALKNSKLSKEEIERLSEDETILQNKLLRRLCTFAAGECTKDVNVRAEPEYFAAITKTNSIENSKFYTDLIALQSRLFNLSLAFDIDIESEFTNCIKESKRIYHALPKESEVTNKEAKQVIGQAVFKLSYTYQVQKLAHEMDVQLDPAGVLALATFYYSEYKEPLIKELPIEDSIFLYLRFVTPYFFVPKNLKNKTVESSARFWLWVSLTQNSIDTLRKQLSQLQSFIVHTLLKTLLLRNCNEGNDRLRMMTFTLITRILCLLPEESAFEFIVDTLESFPFPHGKSYMLVIFKDLILNKCPFDHAVNELTSKLSNLTISNSKESRSFINLDNEKVLQVQKLAITAIENANATTAKQTDINLVSNYLGFFSSLLEHNKLKVKSIEDFKSKLKSIKLSDGDMEKLQKLSK
ncbi:hypothetical protein KAFR_0G02280 [Kazachstania africana CBS 2517]|uniref:TATA-binding protein interacting (TIP20) domain-containing protein n=1 Tax=Kazachstania africana (strain ATCC 22294 / BCRC 22015 / CBS 2517 / CECT 1963 / NBRC 1671 / NRRL Y-8276) TaxID=1071382 RepID=H2AY12_KAZAF|nr:hypothetical protein KAFR_0G02280 [Kazachstania africana CBS 2517]CCF59262.1 hypothetical protein KAFR_0G02280 [Kazachstania africana CBS 2517]